MIIDGKAIAAQIKDDIAKTLSNKKWRGGVPGLGIVVVGNNDASAVYVGIKEKVARDLGFYIHVEKLAASVSEKELCKTIVKMDIDQKIHGVLLQLPLPKKLSYQFITNIIVPEKDVDCMTERGLGALLKGESHFAPPTAEAVLQCIESTGMKVKGADIAVVGAGFFGRQIAMHLLNNGASVSVLHEDTKLVDAYTKHMDVVVSAVGKAGIITGSMIKKGSVVIDVGISVVDGKVKGDVDEKTVSKKAGFYTPVPGGVGPVTVACVMRNVLEVIKKQSIR